MLQKYEDTYYPSKIIGAGKAAYVERNFEMIDKCNFCVIYYDENYTPAKKRSKRKDLTGHQPKSGTKIAYDYAIKKGVKIINIIKNE